MSSASARAEKLSSAAPTSASPASSPSAKNRSIDPDSLQHLPQDPQQRGEIDAAGPAVHHRAQLRMRRRPDRTRARMPAGCGPMIRNSVSMELSTLATRPNASAAAQKPATSRSAGAANGRTRCTGSLAESSRL